ncbi:MAG TPA: hypothetical protein VFL92_02380 [Sphingomonas sp.]|nr:hypothetical protein [Sphingomonas sp.]
MGESVESKGKDAARLVRGGATLLAGSVLADSAMEHYRGSFHNPAMTLPLVASSALIAFNTTNAGGEGPRAATHGAAIAIGLAGLGFHLFNVDKRPGGASFTNFFYGAPVGAPGALLLAGAVSALADGLKRGQKAIGPVRIGSGRAAGALAAFGIAGTVAEAGLLHLRGAFHDPFMWAPVTLPPLAAASLAVDTIRAQPSRISYGLLGATVALGFIGVGFHSWGVARNMGGWRNWRQNLLAGPPIPAPPAFTALALVGLAALLLMGRKGD